MHEFTSYDRRDGAAETNPQSCGQWLANWPKFHININHYINKMSTINIKTVNIKTVKYILYKLCCETNVLLLSRLYSGIALFILLVGMPIISRIYSLGTCEVN